MPNDPLKASSNRPLTMFPVCARKLRCYCVGSQDQEAMLLPCCRDSGTQTRTYWCACCDALLDQGFAQAAGWAADEAATGFGDGSWIAGRRSTWGCSSGSAGRRLL